MDSATSFSSSADRASVAAPSASRLSSVRHPSAGSAPLVGKLRGINGNSMLARRYREIATAIADDLGGPDKLSEPTKIIVRQAASLTLQVEALQTKIIAGEDVNNEQLTRLANSLSRMLHRLGLKKLAPKPPTLLSQMASGQ
jgi:hypothetical protein